MMKRMTVLGLFGLIVLALPVAASWSGWTYLGDDGRDPGVTDYLDIRNHGYKVENGLWMFKADFHGAFPTWDIGSIEPPETFSQDQHTISGASTLGTYRVAIDCRPGGQASTGWDYVLTCVLRAFVIPEPPEPPFPPKPVSLISDVIIFPMFYITEYSENGSARLLTMPYSEFGDNYLVLSIGVENLDVQYDTIDFQWQTLNLGGIVDTTQMYEVDSSAIPITMVGLVTLSAILLVPFFALYLRKR